MALHTVSLHGAGQTELLRLARDALRRATSSSNRAVAPHELVKDLGLLSQTLGCMDDAREVIHAELTRRSREGCLAVTEGSFTGEPSQAMATVDLWVSGASASTAVAQRALDNAHITASGLAETR